MPLLIILLIIFGGFSFICILFWMTFNSKNYFDNALKKPIKLKEIFFSKDSEDSEWLVMYYVTKIFLVSLVLLILIYVYYQFNR